MKRCTRCHVEKPDEEFYAEARKRDGRRPLCKECDRKEARDRMHKRRHEGPVEVRLYDRARARADTQLRQRHRDEWDGFFRRAVRDMKRETA